MYQVWHFVSDAASPLDFGPITSRLYDPFTPLGLRVNALDLLFLPQPLPLEARAACPSSRRDGLRQLYFGDDIVAVTSFTPVNISGAISICLDIRAIAPSAGGQNRRYIVAIENYYHLVILTMKAFLGPWTKSMTMNSDICTSELY